MGRQFGTVLGGGEAQRYYGPHIHGLKRTDMYGFFSVRPRP